MRDGTKLFTIIMAPKSSPAPLPFMLLRTPVRGQGIRRRSVPDPVRATARRGRLHLRLPGHPRAVSSREGEFVMNRPCDQGQGRRRNDRHLRHDRVAAQERPRQQRPGRRDGHLLSRLADRDGGDERPPGDEGGLAPGADDRHLDGRRLLPPGRVPDELRARVQHHDASRRRRTPTSMSARTTCTTGISAWARWRRSPTAWASTLPTWRSFVEHPTYDSFWQSKAVRARLDQADGADAHRGRLVGPGGLLRTAGDLQGARAERRAGPEPDRHGAVESRPVGRGRRVVARRRSSSGVATGRHFRDEIQAPFFAWYLKDQGPDVARRSDGVRGRLEPLALVRRLAAEGSRARRRSISIPTACSPSRAPAAGAAFTSYVSDPAKPVPYRHRPIQPTYYGAGSEWYDWLVEDQRFVRQPARRRELEHGVAGGLTWSGRRMSWRSCSPSTTGSDADWVVKLIDVYPGPGAGRREDGRLPADGLERNHARPLPEELREARGDHRRTPCSITPWTCTQQAYRFQKGHRIMVQVQSTWFPLYDRNPQTFVPNIFLAKPADVPGSDAADLSHGEVSIAG